MEANQQNNVNRPIIPPLKKPILPDQVVKNNASESIKKNFELAKEYMFPEKIIQKFLEENV